VGSEPPKLFSMIHKFSKTLPKFNTTIKKNKNEFRKKMGVSYYTIN
jgi:hypothetical protein